MELPGPGESFGERDEIGDGGVGSGAARIANEYLHIGVDRTNGRAGCLPPPREVQKAGLCRGDWIEDVSGPDLRYHASPAAGGHRRRLCRPTSIVRERRFW